MEDKVVIITGSAFGIGRAIALGAARQHASCVIIADLKAEQKGAERTAEDCRAAGAKDALFLPCDVADPESVKDMVKAALQHCGRLDVLFANAGISPANVEGAGGWTHMVDDAAFARIIQVNLLGVFYSAKYALPHLVESRGNIVTTASSFGLTAAHFSASYAASKGGVVQLTRQLAKDYGPVGVRVNCICPGYCSNAMGRSIPDIPNDSLPDPSQVRGSVNPSSLQEDVVAKKWAMREAAASKQPIGRQASTDEIAAGALFLASPSASFITGVILPVDGGCTSTFAGSELQTGYDPSSYVSPL